MKIARWWMGQKEAQAPSTHESRRASLVRINERVEARRGAVRNASLAVMSRALRRSYGHGVTNGSDTAALAGSARAVATAVLFLWRRAWPAAIQAIVSEPPPASSLASNKRRLKRMKHAHLRLKRRRDSTTMHCARPAPAR